MKQKKFTQKQPKNILTYNTQLYVTPEIFDFWKNILTEQHDCVNYTIKYILENNKHDGQHVGCRYYSKSGLIYDADWNAAINIKNRFEHPISKEEEYIVPLHYLIGRVSSITQMFTEKSLEQAINY